MGLRKKILALRKVYLNQNSYYIVIPKDWAEAHGIDGDTIIKWYTTKQEPDALILMKGEDTDE